MERTEAKAVAKTVRIAPRKTRLVIDLIRGKDVADAFAILRNQPQKESFCLYWSRSLLQFRNSKQTTWG